MSKRNESMDAQNIVIQLPGSAPYGFRLVGGDTVPLVVSKIRPYSKAQQHGVCEGDIVLAINGICSTGLKHSTATGLTETDSLGVTLHVLRGPGCHSESRIQRAFEELRGSLRLLKDSEAAQLVEASGHGPLQIIPGTSVTPDSPPDSPISASSSSTPFKLQMPPSGGLKQMRSYRQQLSRDSNTSPPFITSPAPSTMTQPYGQINLKKDLQSLGNPAGDDKGFYSRQEQTFQEGDTTRKVTEEVSKDRYGGTTVTRIVKQEVANRQIPMNERVVFDEPAATFSVTAGGPGRFGQSYGRDDGDDYTYRSNQPVQVQTYNTSSNSWQTSSSTPQRGGGQTYDFNTMIQELENSAPGSWQQSVTGTNKGGNQHWNTTTSWNVAGDQSGRRNGNSGSTVEMRPGAEIQIQFQPQSGGYNSVGQSRYESNRQPTAAYYPNTDTDYPFSSSSAALTSSSQSMPVIQVYSSNDDRPHVQLQTNSRGLQPAEEKPFMTEVYETTRTTRYQTEEDGPVSVKQWSSSGPSAGGQSYGQKASNKWDSGSGQQWGENGRDGDVLVRNESGSLTRSTSVQGTQPWNQPARSTLRQQSQGPAADGGVQSSYSSWKPTDTHSSSQGYHTPDSGRGQPFQSQKSYPGDSQGYSHQQRDDDYTQINGGFGTSQRAVPAGPTGPYQQQDQWSSQGQSGPTYQKQNSWAPASQQGYQGPEQGFYGSQQQSGPQGYQSGPGNQQQSGYQDNLGYQQSGSYDYQGPQHGPHGSQGYQGYQQGGPGYQGYQEGPQSYQQGGNQQWGGQGYPQGGPQQYGPQGYQQGSNQQWGPQGYQPGGNQQWGPQGYHPGGPAQGYGSSQQGQGQDYYGGGAPPAPPPPAPMAPPPPPPPQSHKNLYGPQAVPERVEVAKVVAHSVLAPENNNSKGQQMFLRRRAMAEKWSTAGAGGPADSEPTGYGGYQSQSNTSSWGIPNQSTSSMYESEPRPQARQAGVGVGLTSDEMAGGGMGRGGQLFAKKKERADRWAAADDQRQAAGRGRVVVGTAVPQQQQQRPPSNNYQPIKINSYSTTPTQQYGANQKYAFTDL